MLQRNRKNGFACALGRLAAVAGLVPFLMTAALGALPGRCCLAKCLSWATSACCCESCRLAGNPSACRIAAESLPDAAAVDGCDCCVPESAAVDFPPENQTSQPLVECCSCRCCRLEEAPPASKPPRTPTIDVSKTASAFLPIELFCPFRLDDRARSRPEHGIAPVAVGDSLQVIFCVWNE